MSLADLNPEELADLQEYAKTIQGQTDPEQLAGRPQVWKVDNRYYVAYYIPGTDAPLVWEATPQELIEQWGGIDATEMPPVDKTMNGADFAAMAPWQAGRVNEIKLDVDDPWTQFWSTWQKNIELRPWMADPDMLATVATAFLEGRDVTADEYAQTEWWQTHTASERQWLEATVNMGDAEIQRQHSDAQRKVTNMMLDLGLKDVNPDIIQIISTHWLTGKWSEEYVKEQINKLADPFAVGTLHPGLKKRVEDKMRQTRVEEDTVRQMASQWLGPTMGQMSDADIERWAGRFRNNPDAKVDFEEFLRKQRMAMFPTYENENLTYEDIVAPFRNLATNVWGQPIRDETMLVDLANLGDFSEAQKRLRKSGLNQGIQKVVTDALDELGSGAIGERVVRSTI